ncbi:translocation/assembly module TamB domain-containing protein [Nitrosococcus watsonii]|uniref:Translocation and assembly module TamB C-terminal domain-containing protein n=1 Tax=Nitrosococcus watsoni (strain C-113) TaxID=105559 RepID=D8KAS1_NITWC|nr:translocation/assembly module TamB domain-containing protein [Nitrosococcus watsonii]ADJ29498.1 protein of unknown function DUF490 [Nitrosococcus watsonii C-113]
MKLLRSIGVFILLFLVLLVGGLAYLTLTEVGTRQLLSQVARVVPGELETHQVEGTLGKALTLTGLRYQTPDFILEIGYFHFAWRPAALLEATFWVEQLHLREVSWRQERPGESTASQEPIVLPEVQLPLKVKAEDVRLQNISLTPLESSPVVIDAVVFNGDFDGQTLQVGELGVAAPQGRVRVSGEIAFQEAYPMAFALAWGAPVPELGKLTGVGKVKGDLRQLTLYQTVQAPFHLQFRSRLFDLLEQPRWVAALEVPGVELQHLSAQWPAIRVSLDLKGAGSLKQFKAQASYQLQEAQAGTLRGNLSVEQLAMGHWLLERLTLRQVEGPARLALRGEVMMAEDQPHMSLAGQWQAMAWPLTGVAQVSSNRGQLTLKGSPAAYRLQLHSALAGQDIPVSEWHLLGTGDTTQFELEKLRGQLLDGDLSGTGHFRWTPDLAWELQLTGESLNLAKQWPEWPGVLSFSTDTNGVLEENAQDITLDLHTLSGSLRGYPVAAQGRVQRQDNTWRIADLKLRSGDSRLSLGGTVSEQLALKWYLSSPDLSQLLPEAQGDLLVKGHAGGPLTRPELTFRLQGQALAYQDYQVKSVQANVDVDLQGKHSSRVRIDASNLILADQTLRSVAIEGGGTPLHHKLSLAVKAPERSLDLGVQGSWKEKEEVWRGEITKTELTDSLIGRWEAPGSTPLMLSRSQVDLAPWCWQRQSAQLCLGGGWQEEGPWQGSFKLANFPLAMLGPLLPEKTALEGMVAGEAQVQGESHLLAQARMQFAVSGGQLTQVTPEGQSLRFPYQGAEARLNVEERGGEASFELLLADPSVAPVKASLRLPSAPLDLTAMGQLPLEGQVSMAFNDLAFLETLLPELQAVQGRLRANLTLGGRVAVPRLRGEVVLEEGRAQVVPLGLKLTKIRLRMEASEQDRLVFTGGVHSGEGQLAINGQVRLEPEAGWPAKVTVTGERFEAMGTSDIRVLVSPQLQITKAEEGIRAEGEVVIPEATLVIKDIESRGGVPVSQDVVIISQEKEAEKKAVPIYARVRIILGDDIAVRAFGFKGGVTGSLLVTETPGKPTRGSGELEIVKGEYKAYGQQLHIRRGQVVFAGPVDDPRLNVEAVREVDNGNIVVGARIRGAASEPVLTLFSEPSMDESNILAYLVLGRPLTGASGDDGELLAKAATSLGLSGGNLLAKRIGKIFGLEDVGIESADNGNGQTQSEMLMLGKQLSPSLYIGYGIGLFERFSSFRIRYTLSKNWSIRAETGLETGADLFYSLER